MTQKIHEKERNAASNVCWQVLCSKITDGHEIEVYDVRTWKFVYFRKSFCFLSHITIV